MEGEPNKRGKYDWRFSPSKFHPNTQCITWHGMFCIISGILDKFAFLHFLHLGICSICFKKVFSPACFYVNVPIKPILNSPQLDGRQEFCKVKCQETFLVWPNVRRGLETKGWKETCGYIRKSWKEKGMARTPQKTHFQDDPPKSGHWQEIKMSLKLRRQWANRAARFFM